MSARSSAANARSRSYKNGLASYRSPYGNFKSDFSGKWAHLYDPDGRKKDKLEEYKAPVRNRSTAATPSSFKSSKEDGGLSLESQIMSDVIRLGGKLNFYLKPTDISNDYKFKHPDLSHAAEGSVKRLDEVDRNNVRSAAPVFGKSKNPSLHSYLENNRSNYSELDASSGSSHKFNSSNMNATPTYYQYNMLSSEMDGLIIRDPSGESAKYVEALFVREPGRWIGYGKPTDDAVLMSECGQLTWISPKGNLDVIFKFGKTRNNFRCYLDIWQVGMKIFKLNKDDEYEEVLNGEENPRETKSFYRNTRRGAEAGKNGLPSLSTSSMYNLSIASERGQVRLLLQPIKGYEVALKHKRFNFKLEYALAI